MKLKIGQIRPKASKRGSVQTNVTSGEDLEYLKLSLIADDNAKWHSQIFFI